MNGYANLKGSGAFDPLTSFSLTFECQNGFKSLFEGERRERPCAGSAEARAFPAGKPKNRDGFCVRIDARVLVTPERS